VPDPSYAPPASPQAGVDAGFPDDAVEVARIAGAWGVKGWLRIQPHSGDPQALFSSKRWYLRPPEGAARRPGVSCPPLLRVIQAREHGDGVVAAVHDVTDRDGAEALRGARIFVSRGSFPTPGEGEFYWVDLIGLEVVNRCGQALGQVAGLLETGAQCVLRVQLPPAGGEKPVERLIPFVDAYVDAVDLAGRRIVVDWAIDY
jgi:16S rRNA processing protein RimM